jgi:hypothetical protein
VANHGGGVSTLLRGGRGLHLLHLPLSIHSMIFAGKYHLDFASLMHEIADAAVEEKPFVTDNP